MPRAKKWLVESSTARVGRAARAALRGRLAEVERYLGQFRADGADQVEVVHQLRVWSRRSDAALKLFKDLAPARRLKKLRQTLQKLRQAAGLTRDCDVFREQLLRGSARRFPALIERLESQRAAGLDQLERLQKKLRKGDRFSRLAERLTQRVRWRQTGAEPRLGPWSRRQLAPLVRAFFRRGGSDLRDAETLHEFRIAGKRLRYALELVGEALAGQRPAALYQRLIQLQDRLGRVCDHQAAAERLAQWAREEKSAPARKQLRSLAAREQRRRRAAQRTFQQWWTPARRQAQEQAWNALLEVK